MAAGVALLCPGQGAQRPGGVAKLPSEARAVFERASALIEIDLWEAGLQWPAEALARPSVLQPLLVAWAVADYERGRHERPDLPAIDYVLGHSSGENSALVLSGAVSFDEGIRFAHERGQQQDVACDEGTHGLLALAGLSREDAERVAAETGMALANHNAEDQTVLGGNKRDFARATSLVEARGGQALVLRLAGAFHTESMRKADEMTEPLIAALEIRAGFTPLIGNARGQLILDAAGVREELSMQYTRPIEWVAALRTAYACGVRTFIVTGPGNAMLGLVRRFARTVPEKLTAIRLNQSSSAS